MTLFHCFIHKVRDRLHFHLYIYKLVLVTAHCTSFFFFVLFFPSQFFASALLSERLEQDMCDVTLSQSSRSKIGSRTILGLPLVLRFLNSSKSADEKLKCVKLPSSHKLLCYYLLCTIREFEVSSQWVKSYGVSTDIPTKYTKHCFLAIVLCEY